MDAADLRVFEAVARLGGMNRAALELNTVQSNVTARIRALEEELGASLFERHSRGVTLTDAGRRLVPYATKIARLIADARRAVEDEGTPGGSLVVGSLETTAAMRLPPILSTFAATYPSVDLVLATGTTCELVDRVLEGRLEGAFVCGPVRHPDLLQQPIFREELTLATAPSIRAGDDAFARGDLRIVVLRAGCSYRQRLEDMLGRRGVIGWRVLEFGTVDAILGCVAAGLGVTLLPKAILDEPARQGRIAMHRVPSEEALVDTVFVRRHDGFVSSALKALLACARPAEVAQAAE